MIQNSAWLKKALIKLGGARHFQRFEKASHTLRQTQDSVLEKIIEENKNTAFGRAHGFDKIHAIDEYRQAVPIADFEDHRPYINRMCRGERDILFPGKSVMYNTTSGTTDKPKLIPVSKPYFDEAYRGLSRLWFYTCLKDNPRIFNGKSLSAVARDVEGHTEDGTPFGSISGVVYRTIPAILKQTYSTPFSVVCIKDYQKKYYAMMRCGLAHNITYIVCPSPSNLIQFHATVMDFFEDLVRDIRDGTLRPDVAAQLPEAERAATLAAFKPDPHRAAFLEKLMHAHGQGLRPRHYWPDCACVNLWKEGNFARVLPKLEGYFPGSTALRSFAYQASEARAGLVFGNDWTYSALMAQVYHFEFIEEAARGGGQPTTLLAHEVEVGKRYYLLFSNGSGLYRYDINDIVEIVGHYNQIPLFTFIQKGEGVTSLSGEKLTEVQVVQAVDETAKRLDVAVPFFTFFCDEEKLAYTLFIEFAAETARKKKEAFMAAFDHRLREINPEYEIKRGSKRLGQPHQTEIGPNAGKRLKEALIQKEMARDGQYKESFLVKRPVIRDILRQMAL
jgi:hypothetical protein